MSEIHRDRELEHLESMLYTYKVENKSMDTENERLKQEIRKLLAEKDKMRAALNARCPVDAMDRGMSPVEAAVYHVWGERCPDFEPECLTCKAWAEYDDNAKLREALVKVVRGTGDPVMVAYAALGGDNG